MLSAWPVSLRLPSWFPSRHCMAKLLSAGLQGTSKASKQNYARQGGPLECHIPVRLPSRPAQSPTQVADKEPKQGFQWPPFTSLMCNNQRVPNLQSFSFECLTNTDFVVNPLLEIP